MNDIIIPFFPDKAFELFINEIRRLNPGRAPNAYAFAIGTCLRTFH